MANTYKKPVYKAEYYDMGSADTVKPASPYQIMQNARELIYEGIGMIDSTVLLFKMEMGHKTALMWADRDFIWLSIKFAPSQTEYFIRRWYTCPINEQI